MYEITSCLSSITQGARCRVCGDVYAVGNRQLSLGCCHRHSNDNHNNEAILGRIAMKLQDNYRLYCMARYPMESGKIPKYEWEGDAERWWWESVAVFFSQCIRSQSEMSAAIKWEFGNACPVKVVSVVEIEFYTGPFFNYMHNAFRVTLKNGRQYAFDPTGVQFGPDWPLLAPWEWYRAVRVHGQLSVSPLGTRLWKREEKMRARR